MLHKSFNRGLHKLIQKIEWPMYVVNVIENTSCSCLDHESNTGRADCPYCLGTGHKIKIRKIKGVHQPAASMSAKSLGMQPGALVSYYYDVFVDGKYGPFRKGDFIVYDDEITHIKRIKEYRSDSNEIQFYEMMGSERINDCNVFLENFQKIVRPES